MREQVARVHLLAVAQLDDGGGELVGRHDGLGERAGGADDDEQRPLDSLTPAPSLEERRVRSGLTERGEDVHARLDGLRVGHQPLVGQGVAVGVGQHGEVAAQQGCERVDGALDLLILADDVEQRARGVGGQRGDDIRARGIGDAGDQRGDASPAAISARAGACNSGRAM